MLPQQYCLRWKYHHSNLQTMFSQLLDRGCFCDVTLACEGQTIRCHRVVLCACSTYFDSLLTNVSTDKDPIIIMRDCKFSDVKALIEFMYKGEINVEHENLSSLLKTAEELRIKGLAEVSWHDDENENETASTRVNVTMSHATNVSSTPTTNNPDSGNSIPMLTPITIHTKDDVTKDGFPNKKKRGRPPLDEEYDSFSTPKSNNIGTSHNYSDSSHLVSVMMDDNSKENTKENEQVNSMSNAESNHSSNGNLSPHNLLIPKIERIDTPDFNRMEMDEDSFAYDQNQSLQSIFLTPQEREEWKDVIKMNDYLTKGRRPQFWEEPFTRKVMDAIKNKNLEMKKAAKLLGVSYGTLYGRYRETYGCLKHPYRGQFGSQSQQQSPNLTASMLENAGLWGALSGNNDAIEHGNNQGFACPL
ncbi:protein tramtrack, beta isoform-like [Culicoides brevitarsis]|uniref:protein tramtrack, beta isoform-like n=1 Tax=Culicoides brevitarsis TaxID=469753 RepID=UPI00307BA616